MDVRKIIWTVTVMLLAAYGVFADDWPQWRGANRDGVSTEQGLLKTWPQGGPERLWLTEVDGTGYGSPAVVGDRLYLAVAKTEEGGRQGHLLTIAVKDGQVLNDVAYGPEWSRGYPGVRCTPTVAENCIFVTSALGIVSCFDLNGKILWQVDAVKEFGGLTVTWGIAESPLVVDGMVFCQPGGSNATVVALDATTGHMRWKAETLSDASTYGQFKPEDTYCSAIIATLEGRKHRSS